MKKIILTFFLILTIISNSLQIKDLDEVINPSISLNLSLKDIFDGGLHEPTYKIIKAKNGVEYLEVKGGRYITGFNTVITQVILRFTEDDLETGGYPTVYIEHNQNQSIYNFPELLLDIARQRNYLLSIPKTGTLAAGIKAPFNNFKFEVPHIELTEYNKRERAIIEESINREYFNLEITREQDGRIWVGAGPRSYSRYYEKAPDWAFEKNTILNDGVGINVYFADIDQDKKMEMFIHYFDTEDLGSSEVVVYSISSLYYRYDYIGKFDISSGDVLVSKDGISTSYGDSYIIEKNKLVKK